jgi:HPt (histidine-containing phosphotransfer) domain-containing protein
VNVKELAERLEMKEGEFLELTDLFLERSLLDFNELRSAIAKCDWQEAARAAHSIKGASVNLGFTEIFEAAKSAETAAHENRLDTLTELASSIDEKLEKISECLRTKPFGSSKPR